MGCRLFVCAPGPERARLFSGHLAGIFQGAEIDHLGVSRRLQCSLRHSASPPTAAVDQQWFILVGSDSGDLLADLVVREVDGSCEVAGIVFFGSPDIDDFGAGLGEVMRSAGYRGGLRGSTTRQTKKGQGQKARQITHHGAIIAQRPMAVKCRYLADYNPGRTRKSHYSGWPRRRRAPAC
jgi:hypothetical protein